MIPIIRRSVSYQSYQRQVVLDSCRYVLHRQQVSLPPGEHLPDRAIRDHVPRRPLQHVQGDPHVPAAASATITEDLEQKPETFTEHRQSLLLEEVLLHTQLREDGGRGLPEDGARHEAAVPRLPGSGAKCCGSPLLLDHRQFVRYNQRIQCY